MCPQLTRVSITETSYLLKPSFSDCVWTGKKKFFALWQDSLKRLMKLILWVFTCLSCTKSLFRERNWASMLSISWSFFVCEKRCVTLGAPCVYQAWRFRHTAIRHVFGQICFWIRSCIPHSCSARMPRSSRAVCLKQTEFYFSMRATHVITQSP